MCGPCMSRTNLGIIAVMRPFVKSKQGADRKKYETPKILARERLPPSIAPTGKTENYISSPRNKAPLPDWELVKSQT